MSVDLKGMWTDASFMLLHKISTHFLISQSKLSCHVINFWRSICCMSIRSYVCKSHYVIEPICSNQSPHVLLKNFKGGTSCSYSPAVKIWCVGTRIMETHLKSIIHVTEFIQSLTYISFHSNIALLVFEQFNGEWFIRSLYLGLLPCCWTFVFHKRRTVPLASQGTTVDFWRYFLHVLVQ
jgi:hypothetical protein